MTDPTHLNRGLLSPLAVGLPSPLALGTMLHVSLSGHSPGVPLVTTTSISWRVSLMPITLPYVECAPTFSSAIAISHLFPDELICLFISHHTSAHMYSLIHIIVTINCSTFLAFHEVMYHCSILTCRTPSTLGAAGNPKSS